MKIAAYFNDSKPRYQVKQLVTCGTVVYLAFLWRFLVVLSYDVRQVRPVNIRRFFTGAGWLVSLDLFGGAGWHYRAKRWPVGVSLFFAWRLHTADHPWPRKPVLVQLGVTRNWNRLPNS